MTKSIANPALLLMVFGAVLTLLQGTPAQALNTKSWVANFGSDGNPCTLASPCATFQRAHDQTNPGGGLGVLTPGDYGAGLSIRKSIHITNDGTGEEASILAPSSNTVAIIVEAGAGDIVSLRGLTIDGQGTGLVGLDFIHGSALHVQNCVIRNFQASNASNFGLMFIPTAVNSQLFVSDTIVFNNGSLAGTGGILVQPGQTATQLGTATLVLDRVHLENNVEGLLIDGRFETGGAGTHAVVRDSVISGNFGNGIHAFTFPGRAPSFALVERSSLVNNRLSGILADGPGATILLKESTITRNGTGVSTVNSGQLISYGTNTNNNNIGAEGVATGFFSAF